VLKFKGGQGRDQVALSGWKQVPSTWLPSLDVKQVIDHVKLRIAVFPALL